jgi:acyl carrier protein/GNAT superfamily N-acetyltransferase
VSSVAEERIALHDRLVAFLEAQETDVVKPLTDRTSLIKSGLLDSLAVFNLTTWVERETGREIDPTTFDLAAEWDTIDQIVSFIARRSTRPGVQETARLRYEIVPYSGGFKSQVAELQRYLWSSDPRLSRQYFEWKYERNPYLQPPLLFLALSGHEVVGMRGVIGSRWELGTPARSIVLPYATDLVTRPDHRNRGLITTILKSPFKELAARGYQYAINLSASPMTLAVSLRLGWRSAGDAGLMVRRGWGWSRELQAHRLLHRIPGLWRLADRLAPIVAGVRGRPFRTLDAKSWIRRGQPARVIVAQAPRPDAMAALVRRLGHDGRLRHVRDVEYFSWRFQNPLATYRFLFHGGEQPDGYLVLEASTSDLSDRNTVTIVDWEGVDDDVKAKLLDAALTWGGFVAINSWSSTLSDSSRNCLANAGFVQPEDAGRFGRRRPAVLIKPVQENVNGGNWLLERSRLLDLESWDLRPLAGLL